MANLHTFHTPGLFTNISFTKGSFAKSYTVLKVLHRKKKPASFVTQHPSRPMWNLPFITGFLVQHKINIK